MKQCSKCGVSKSLDDFSRSKQTLCGKSSWCKKCQVVINRRYKEYYKEYYKKYGKQQNKKNYDKRRQYGISVRAITYLGLKLALEVYDRAKRKCEKCKEENDLTIHHKDGKGRHNQEKGLGVNNNSDNLIVLCRRCHGSIHGKESQKNKRK